jgi:hypothetical protein
MQGYKLLTAIALFAAAAFVSVPAFAQSVPVRTSIPRGTDGKPDFTGVWAGPAFRHQSGPGDTDTPGITRYDKRVYQDLFRPGGRELFYRKHNGDLLHDDPQALCMPVGFPRISLSPYAQQWIQTPTQLIILYEYMHFFRVIPIGAPNRPHNPNVELTWMGDSIAWWEGDTLVIDTIGLKEWPLVSDEPGLADTILYHSDALHVVERVSYKDPMMGAYELTIDDPKIFTRPWTTNWGMRIHPTWKLLEFVCQENNRCEAGKCQPSVEQQNQR